MKILREFRTILIQKNWQLVQIYGVLINRHSWKAFIAYPCFLHTLSFFLSTIFPLFPLLILSFLFLFFFSSTPLILLCFSTFSFDLLFFHFFFLPLISMLPSSFSLPTSFPFPFKPFNSPQKCITNIDDTDIDTLTPYFRMTERFALLSLNIYTSISAEVSHSKKRQSLLYLKVHCGSRAERIETRAGRYWSILPHRDSGEWDAIKRTLKERHAP